MTAKTYSLLVALEKIEEFYRRRGGVGKGVYGRTRASRRLDGAHIREQREAQGMTLADFAEAYGLPVDVLARLEAGSVIGPAAAEAAPRRARLASRNTEEKLAELV